MDAATMEIVQGVTLEAICAPNLPDTESLVGDIGSMHPVLTYAAAGLPIDDELRGAGGADDVIDQHRDELDTAILAGLLRP